MFSGVVMKQYVESHVLRLPVIGLYASHMFYVYLLGLYASRRLVSSDRRHHLRGVRRRYRRVGDFIFVTEFQTVIANWRLES